MRRYILPLLLILALSTMGCKENIDDVSEATIKRDYTLVKAQSVDVTNDPIPVNAIGRISSDKEVKLSFKIGGIISSIKADEGDYVKKGKLLATIRTNEIDAQVLKAERSLSKAQRDLERVTTMYDDQAATLENVQDLTTLLEVTEADLEIAKFNQQYAKIVSPVSGRILRRNAEPNELVNPGMPIFIVTNSSGSNYVMKAALSDKDVNRINYGDKVSMSFDTYPNESFGGNISQISESADPRTGTFDVDIIIKNHKKRLRNGNIGRVEIYPQSVETLLRIPMDAIVETKDQNIVIFSPIQGDTIVREWQAKPVHIDEDFVLVEIIGDNYPQRVITAGSPYLMDGDKIKITNDVSQTITVTEANTNGIFSNTVSTDKGCIIILGAYAIDSNANKMKARLSRAGYQPITRPFRSLTQVGVPVSCENSQSRKVLAEIKSKYAADAVLLNN